MKRVYFGIGQGFTAAGLPIKSAELKRARARAFEFIAREFGGFHASQGNGGWIDPRGKLILESSLGITCFTDSADSIVYAAAEHLRALFNQESVLLAIDPIDSLQFVSGPAAAAA